MDIPNKKNKRIDGEEDEVKDKEIEEPKVDRVVAASALTLKYHFPPQNGFQGIEVTAPDLAQAMEIYKQTRKPVNPEKVDQGTNENNQ